MEKIKSRSQFEAMISIELTEKETRALQALALYGDKSFLEVFCKHLGESYLKPHADGISSLFDTIRKELPKHLKNIDETRKIWKTQ